MIKTRLSGIIVLISFLISFVNASGQVNSEKKETFKVWGNCGMCKATIEKSLKSVEGVKSSKWNVATKKMTVKYDEAVISLDAIKKAIADVGYDTKEHKASDEVYSNLHGCCQYDRK